MHLPKSNLPGLVTMCIYLQGVQVSHCHNLTDLASAFDAARHHRQVTIFDLCGRALEGALKTDLLIQPTALSGMAPSICTGMPQ